MENSSSTHAAWFSLAVAAMVGATVAAASSYLLHCKAVDRLQSQKMLDLGDLKKRKTALRKRGTSRDDMFGSNSTPVAPELLAHENVKSVLNSALPPRLPKADSTDSISTIPPGLPRVQTRKEGRCSNSSIHVNRIPQSMLKLLQFMHSSCAGPMFVTK